MNEEINTSKNNSIKTILIVILALISVGSIGFITYDKLINKEETKTEENNNQKVEDNKEIVFSSVQHGSEQGFFKTNNGYLELNDTNIEFYDENKNLINTKTFEFNNCSIKNGDGCYYSTVGDSAVAYDNIITMFYNKENESGDILAHYLVSLNLNGEIIFEKELSPEIASQDTIEYKNNLYYVTKGTMVVQTYDKNGNLINENLYGAKLYENQIKSFVEYDDKKDEVIWTDRIVLNNDNTFYIIIGLLNFNLKYGGKYEQKSDKIIFHIDSIDNPVDDWYISSEYITSANQRFGININSIEELKNQKIEAIIKDDNLVLNKIEYKLTK